MSGEINVSLRRGLIRIAAEIPIAAGPKGLEAFVEEIGMSILGYAPDMERIQQRPAEPKRNDAAERSGIPRSGLLSKKQVLGILGVQKSTLDNRIRAGLIPQGGKDGGRRVWNAEDIWAIAEKIAGQKDDPKKAPWLRDKRRVKHDGQ
jgi:predicted DNA-binding transcriptional regulator AlpA